MRIDREFLGSRYLVSRNFDTPPCAEQAPWCVFACEYVLSLHSAMAPFASLSSIAIFASIFDSVLATLASALASAFSAFASVLALAAFAPAFASVFATFDSALATFASAFISDFATFDSAFVVALAEIPPCPEQAP